MLPTSIASSLVRLLEMLHLDGSVRVLVDRQRVDHTDCVFVMQSLELSDDLAVKFGVVEAKTIS